MFLGVLIGKEIIREKRALVLYTVLLSLVPGLIFTSTGINNDVLVQFLMFLGLLVLIRWHKNPSDKKFYCLALVIGIGLLTKANFLILYITSVLCFSQPSS